MRYLAIIIIGLTFVSCKKYDDLQEISINKDVDCIIVYENMVRNGSFEEYTKLPTQHNDINGLIGWTSPNPFYYVPYFNSAAGQYRSVPANIYGYQEAKDGNGYVALMMWKRNVETRYYITSEFTRGMIEGETYIIEFYVSPAEYQETFVNTIGAYISYEELGTNIETTLDLNAQICTYEKMNDTNKWYRVAGEYKAKGGEKFITIGNFRTKFLQPDGDGIAMSYVDKVTVIEKSNFEHIK